MKRVLRFLGLAALCGLGLNALATPVAKVGETEYATFEEAIGEWTSGTTLTLLSDVTVSTSISVAETKTLNLGSYTLTGQNCHAIKLEGTGGCNLTINADASNPGKVTTSSSSYNAVYANYNDCKYAKTITINGGVYERALTFNKYSSGNSGEKGTPLSVTINGGTFKSSITAYRCYYLTINGGTFDSFSGYTAYQTSTCKSFYYGGRYKSTLTTSSGESRAYYYGNVDIKSATNANYYYIDADGYYVLTKGASYLPADYEALAGGYRYLDANVAIAKTSSGTVQLSAGVAATQDKSFSSGTLTLDATAEGASYSGNITLSGSNAKFIVKMSSEGSFTGDVTTTASKKQLHVDRTESAGVITYTYSCTGVVTEANAEVKVGDKYYGSIYDAFYDLDGNTENKTIVLLKDVSNGTLITNGRGANPVDGKTVVTVDLNGRSFFLQSIGTANQADCTLTVIDSSPEQTGRVTNTAANFFKLALITYITGGFDVSGKYTLIVKGGTWCVNPEAFVYDGQTYDMVPEGYETIDNENGTWTVKVAPPEAELDGVDYLKANDAIAAAHSGSTVTFKLGTATQSKTLGAGETLTLVFAGGSYDYATLVKGAAACDLTYEVSEDGKTVVIKSAKNDAKCQAVIVDEDGNAVYYPTFADAVKDAAEKGTVSVNREIAAGEEVVIANKEVTLDLAGQVVKADVLFTGDANDFIIDSVGGGKVLGTISVKDGCTLKIYAGTFAQEIPSAWVADKDAEGNPLCVVKQDDGTFKVIANKVEVKEIELTEENVEIVDEKGEPVPEEKKEAAQQAVIEATEKLQEAVAAVPPVDTGIEKASKEPVVTPSGEVVAGAAKASVVDALKESLKEDIKTEDIPAQAVNQITATSDISERLEIRFDSQVSQVKDVTVAGEPTKMEANLDVVVWDVKPIVKTVITIGEGEAAVEKVVEAQLPDEEVKKNPVTFRLAVSDPNAKGAYVRHIGHGEFEDETIFCKVQGSVGGLYVELTVNHFSLFEVRTTGEVVEELDDAIGIINLGVPGAGKELAAGVPFTTAGTTAKLDDLVLTGLANGDKILVQNGDGYDEYTFNGTTWGDVELAPGTTFWYQSANGSEAPLTLAGLVTNSVSTAVAQGSETAPKATLLVNPFNSAADLVVAVGSAAAEGDQIAFAGDNDGKDVRYVFKDGQWGYYTKPAAVTAAGIYLADDVFNEVSAITVPGGKGAWYISKGGAPTVAWSTAGVTGSSEQIASSDAQIYGVLDWFVALDAADMDSFGHEGIRLVGYGADGEVFRYGRDFAGDTFAASNTVFLGLGGGTGAAASFAVELLDADDNVIAVSERVTDLGSALTATYAGSKAPATATTPVQFTNFGAGDKGEFAFLRAAFAGKGVVKSLADGCEVVLTNDIAGCVTLADNLGAVTLDLNSHSISGTVATAEAPGGNAILISEETHLPEATNPTALTILNRGSFAQVAGGDGFSGVTPQAGGSAIKSDSTLAVTVKVEGTGTGTVVQGGKGGSGVDGAEVAAAGLGVDGATIVGGASYIADGADGVPVKSWAWCLASNVAEIPYGVSYDSENEKYLFWERDDAGNATFNFAKVAGWDITDDAIHFVNETINVDQFVVPASAGSLTFVGEDDTILAAAADACAFEVTTGADDVRAWTNLMFTGSGIAVTGGRIEVAKCEFSGCSSEQFGGAIAAHALSGESTVADSTFTDCFAQDGGAIFATGASASGVTLKVVRSTFTENTAGTGGAISTQTRDGNPYTVALDIANSTFLRNQTLPGCSGGAIAAQGNVSIDADATVDAPGTTLFEGNRAYVSGGAIALVASREEEACDAEVLIGRGVRFVGNAVTGGIEALGGAIAIGETPEDCKYELAAEGVLFKDNAVTGEAGAYEAFGGAIFVYGGAADDDTEVVIDTCVFDGNDAFAGDGDVAIYGGALEIEYSTATVRNSTFRNSNIEAVSFLGGNVAVENCVAVGNNTAGHEDVADLLFDSVGSAKMTYTAYGKVDLYGTTLSDDSGNNLADRTTAIYDGDLLKLNPVGFNPVAVFGLTQAGVKDFEGTLYGYDGYSWSMGAFEAVTVKLTVTVTGDREYNGNQSSDGIEAFGFALSTNGVSVAGDFCAELGDVTTAFEVTAWEYGGKDVGFYASTNAAETAKVTATVALVAEDKEVLLNALDFIYEGTISPTVNGLAMTIEPLDYAWTGSEIVPTSVTVIDTLSGDTLVEGVDYRIEYGDNINPTDSAKVIVTGSRNYYGGTAVSNFWITAYTVNHVFDGEVLGTELFGATGGQEVVGHELNEIPAGYCFDWQNSVTNGTALKIGEGGLTAIDVLYWTDENGDQVPDKFQKKITAKVVNGEWNDDALSGLNQTVWVTLATEDGKWDAVDGIGAFGTDHASHALPSAGLAPDGKSQAQGGWIAFAGGSGYVVPDPSALRITADMTPILLYGYIAKTSTSGGRTGHGAKGGTTTSSESTLADLAKQYKVQAALTSFSLDSAAGMATMAPKKSLMQSGTEIEPIDLKGSTVTIRVMRTLGGPAEEYPAQVGSDGNVTVPAEGAQGFYQLAE